MQLGREEKYGVIITTLRVNPKQENARFEASDIRKGLTIGEKAIHIQGNLEADALELTTSVFGLKEDGTPFITTVEELEDKETTEGVVTKETFILKGNPRIVHKGEVNINTTSENADLEVVFSVRPRLAIGYDNEGEVLVVALESPGLTVKQLGQLMLELGCIEAINVYGKDVGKIEYKGIHAEEKKEAKPTRKKKK